MGNISTENLTQARNNKAKKTRGKRRTGRHKAAQLYLHDTTRPGLHCVVCMQPKDRRSFPICPKCERR